MTIEQELDARRRKIDEALAQALETRATIDDLLCQLLYLDEGDDDLKIEPLLVRAQAALSRIKEVEDELRGVLWHARQDILSYGEHRAEMRKEWPR